VVTIFFIGSLFVANSLSQALSTNLGGKVAKWFQIVWLLLGCFEMKCLHQDRDGTNGSKDFIWLSRPLNELSPKYSAILPFCKPCYTKARDLEMN
jgi:hypothetical protein